VLASNPRWLWEHFSWLTIWIINGRMKLQCRQCGIRGGSDLAFIWYSKKVGTKTLWLCPDCYGEFEDDNERDRFLAGKKEKDARG
jgi:hypothetical protein